MRKFTAFLFAAALAAVLTSCSSVPTGDFTRDDTSLTLPEDMATNSPSETETTEEAYTKNTENESGAGESITEILPLSVVLLSGEKWSDTTNGDELASTILFNGGKTFVMTVNSGENAFINCMGSYKIIDEAVHCTVTECDLGGKLTSFTLEYSGSSLVYRGETIGTVADGTAFVR